MTMPTASSPATSKMIDDVLHRMGQWLQQHQNFIQNLQWLLVLVYLFLLIVPSVLPLPDRTAHIWSNLTLAAQFAFWGIWWPFVLLSMLGVGRLWCGILCPEGTLTEAISKKGRGYSVPRWISWRGWPFVAFACTTIYGQMISVYQYPKPVLLILGGSTAGALVVGYFWGRSKRVWCRYLCPVNGVFGLLSKLAPVHFRVDQTKWHKWQKPSDSAAIPHINCAPLVPLKTMQGASLCHMCGRCSDFRGAISLARRSPNYEIVHVMSDKLRPWDSALIFFGMIGLAAGAFHWSESALFIYVKQYLAGLAVQLQWMWLIDGALPWWILTNYPDQNDVMTPLDGVVMIGFIITMSLAVGSALFALCALAARMISRQWYFVTHHFAQGFIPIAGCGVFLGLSALTVTLLKTEGIIIPYVLQGRLMLLAGAALWSCELLWQISRVHQSSLARRLIAFVPLCAAVALASLTWASLFVKMWKF